MEENKFFVIKNNEFGATWKDPRWARFKLQFRMRGRDYHPTTHYFSLDLQTISIDGITYFRKDEEEGLSGLINRVLRKKPTFSWIYATLFVNITHDINTTRKFSGSATGGWDIIVAEWKEGETVKWNYKLNFIDLESHQLALKSKNIKNRYLDRNDLLNQLLQAKILQRKFDFYKNNLIKTKPC